MVSAKRESRYLQPTYCMMILDTTDEISIPITDRENCQKFQFGLSSFSNISEKFHCTKEVEFLNQS
jgi:hypothetical protein